MGYVRSENNFAEYQLGEGFGAAVTGDNTASDTNNGTMTGKQSARLAQREMSRLPAGLQGYEGFEGFDGLEGASSSIAHLAKENMGKDPAGLQGFDAVSDDAFAGYTNEVAGMGGLGGIGVAHNDDDDDDDDKAFDGYGALAGTPEESFHTFFHRASMATTDSEVIRLLGKAVKMVSDDTPEAIKKEYYDLAMEMLKRRKNTNLRYLDMQRAEIESNLGWLVNSKLPKTGGFNAMLKTAVGTVGAKLAQGDKEQIKNERQMELGRKLQKELKRTGLSGAEFSGASITVKYIGIVLAGLAIASAVYFFVNKRSSSGITVVSKSKRKSR